MIQVASKNLQLKIVQLFVGHTLAQLYLSSSWLICFSLNFSLQKPLTSTHLGDHLELCDGRHDENLVLEKGSCGTGRRSWSLFWVDVQDSS